MAKKRIDRLGKKSKSEDRTLLFYHSEESDLDSGDTFQILETLEKASTIVKQRFDENCEGDGSVR